MTVSLRKGQGVSLRKNEFDLSSVTIGLGWDINEEKKGFLGGIFGKKEEEYDLDVIAFLCNAAGKVTDLGNVENGKPTLVNGDIVFFNSLRHKSGQIWLTGDNRTGAGDGDDEQIIVKLNSIDPKYEKIVFIVQIYNGEKLQQHFGKVQNAFIRAVDGKNVEMITEVNFSQDIGLIFDINERRLQGTPGQSGDFELTVKWSCSSHRDNEKKLLFVVNPDPKSLWKVIDPPSDAPFYKKSIDHQSVCRSGIHIAGASRRGRSHEHVGSFRDDDYYLNFSDVSGWSVLLVADGAGSAKYSREGSRIVSETVGNYLFNQFKTEKGLEIKNRVLRWNSEDQRAVWEFMNHHFRQAAVLAVNNISSAAILAEDKVKSFSTTLLATVTFRDGADLFAASFWLGDGAIAAYGPAGKVRVLGTPDSGEYAGQTRFLDADAVSDAGFSKRISIGKWNDISHLVLMTDGVSDPWFETDNGLQNPQKWDRLMAELSPLLTDPEHASAQLVEWLNYFSPGNHDDRTIIVLW
ncbi:tellurium resistance protein TerX [Klebsiella pneumoniae]|nr:tellurium resistance protein TerX [Klebsiella pneumoniae]